MLQKISNDVSKLIKAQQYIHSTYTIIKELVENSLDAASSNIKIVVEDSFITVEDDGEGVDDLENICKAGHTSKEDNSYKILGIEYAKPEFSHGFRGQALSSIKEQCDLVITSKCRNSCFATSKDYTTGETKKCPRENGTTVKVSNIFKNCPIRRTINEKSIRKHLAQVLSLLRAFTYVYDVHFTLVHKGKTLFVDRGSSNTKEFSICRHGEPCLSVSDSRFEFYLFPLDKTKTKVVLLDRRVCALDRICSTIDRVFKMFFDHPPTFVLVVKDGGDVNLAIDKSEVILRNSKYIENKIKSEMDRYFASKQLIEGDAKKIKGNTELYDGPSHIPKLIEEDGPTPDYALPKDVDLRKFRILASPSNGTVSQDKPRLPVSGMLSCSAATFDGGHDHFSCGSQRSPAHPDCMVPRPAYTLIREESLHHGDVVIDKPDFKRMQIIGQFNQGFILCTLEKNQRHLLIAVDQHAADEIYNFESLKSSFVLKKQKLLQPIELNLSALQSLVLEESMAIFEKNGFFVSDNRLVAIPMYQGVLFSVDDFYVLLEDVAKGVTVSGKYRDIMATKACRKSVMIGSGLCLKDMRAIVDNLAFLDLPWNCPHGRPTFKVLSEL